MYDILKFSHVPLCLVFSFPQIKIFMLFYKDLYCGYSYFNLWDGTFAECCLH